MVYTLHMSAATTANGELPGARWVRESVFASKDVHPLIERVAAAMATSDYAQRDIFSTRLALEEALVNAIKHGHQGDVTKEVRVGYAVTPQQVLVSIEDQGPGFHAEELPDPLDPENLE